MRNLLGTSLSRREALGVAATGALLALAGCSGASGQDEGPGLEPEPADGPEAEATPETEPEPEPEPAPRDEPPALDLDGTAWRAVGDASWGQVAPGTVVEFGATCNLYSPADDWLLRGSTLMLTGPFGDEVTFEVEVADADHISLSNGPTTLELERVEVVAAPAGADSALYGTSWKSVGDGSWGQVSPGTVVQFGDTCNLYSPWDAWTLWDDGGALVLSVSGPLGGSYDFEVKALDADRMVLARGDVALEFERRG